MAGRSRRDATPPEYPRSAAVVTMKAYRIYRDAAYSAVEWRRSLVAGYRLNETLLRLDARRKEIHQTDHQSGHLICNPRRLFWTKKQPLRFARLGQGY